MTLRRDRTSEPRRIRSRPEQVTGRRLVARVLDGTERAALVALDHRIAAELACKLTGEWVGAVGGRPADCPPRVTAPEGAAVRRIAPDHHAADAPGQRAANHHARQVG